MLGLLINPPLTTIVYLAFPSLGGHCHFTSAMGDSSGAHLTLNAPVYKSLGAPRTNNYNLETHSECHQQLTLVSVQLCLVML